eukprot:scaffold4059_cov177-Amphora_coffeaeformis.AAC.14
MNFTTVPSPPHLSSASPILRHINCLFRQRTKQSSIPYETMPSVRRSRLSFLSRSSHGSDAKDDDTWSLGSTLSVDRGNKKSYMVKFDLSSTVKHNRSPLEDNELKTRWYSSKDYDKMKNQRFNLGRALEKEDQHTTGKYSETGHALLWKLYEKCSGAKDDTDKCLLKKKDMQKLAKILRNPDRVGAECASNSDVVADKLDRRYNILRHVMETQSFGSGSVPIHIMLNGPSKDPEEEARRASEKVSLCSRLFARHIAQAAAMEL